MHHFFGNQCETNNEQMFETKYEDKRDTECEDNCEKVYATKCEQFMISDVRQTMTPSASRYVICDM